MTRIGTAGPNVRRWRRLARGVDSSAENDGGAIFGNPQERKSGVDPPDRKDREVSGKPARTITRELLEGMNNLDLPRERPPRARTHARERLRVKGSCGSGNPIRRDDLGCFPHGYDQTGPGRMQACVRTPPRGGVVWPGTRALPQGNDLESLPAARGNSVCAGVRAPPRA